ncbi:MAG: hypothetical protein NWP37_01545, partial [Pontimonas sp.]|nr:hypothetical protein [Pontimonas sp.]
PVQAEIGLGKAQFRADSGRLAEAAAETAGISLPTSSLLRELFETAMADPDLADKDWSAVAEITLNQNKS